MKRKFLSNIIFLIGLNLMVKPVWIFGIEVGVQNGVGSEAYGFYFAMFNFSYLFHVILDIGITNYNNRSIAQDNSLFTTYLSNILAIKVALTLFYFLITFSIAWLLDFDDNKIKLLAYLAVNQGLISLIFYFRSNISGLHFFKTDGVLSVLDKVIMIVICSLLLFDKIPGISLTIESFIYAQTISLIIAGLFAFILVLARSKFLLLRPQLPIIKRILKQSYPFAIIYIMMAIYYRIDGVMIEELLPTDGALEAGYYAASFRLLDGINMIGFLFASLLLPIFSKMLIQKQKIEPLLLFSFRSLITISLALSITCFFFRKEIIYFLYVDATNYSSEIFGLLIFAFIPISMVYIFGTILTANNNLKQMNLITFFGIIINITLNYFLIMKFKAYGATQATVFTQVIIALSFLMLTIYHFKLTANFKLIIQIVLYIAGLIAINHYLSTLFQNWVGNFTFIAILSVILAFLLKLIDIKELASLYRANDE